MNDCVWIVNAEQEHFLGGKGISGQYIIPCDQMNCNESKIQRSRLWVILRKTDDRCFGVLTVKKVEQFCEGYYQGDFLLSCDLSQSLRLATSYQDSAQNIVGIDFTTYGIHEIKGETSSILEAMVRAAIRVKFTKPSKIPIQSNHLRSLTKSDQALARIALAQMVSLFSLDQIWASGIGSKLPPFAFFAEGWLAQCGYNSTNIQEWLKKLDPTTYFSTNISSTSSHNIESIKRIDIEFREINPDNIFARRFISSNNTIDDAQLSLKKTEAAERLHQEMLRDISCFLKTNHIVPYESTSIDLMTLTNEVANIFEIKTATLMNITSQAAKGAFQLACYINALSDEYTKVVHTLILYDIGNDRIQSNVIYALKTLGVKCLVYDKSKEWPCRVKGLLDLCAVAT